MGSNDLWNGIQSLATTIQQVGIVARAHSSGLKLLFSSGVGVERISALLFIRGLPMFPVSQTKFRSFPFTETGTRGNPYLPIVTGKSSFR
jgi:hypothetical protein